MVDQIRFFAGAARVLEGRSHGEYMRGHTSSIRREPVGVVGQVAPWNYPMMMAIWKLAPALAAGCTVVLKPSDTTPASSVWMGKALQEFYPPGVVNVICGDRDTGAALTSHTRTGPGLHHRVDRRRHRGGDGGGQERHPRASGAGRQGTGRRVRRRVDRGRGRGRGHCRLLQRRPGLHGGDPGDRPGRDLRRLRGRADRQGPGDQDRRSDDDDVLYGSINNANQLAHIAGLVDRAAAHADVTAGGHAAGPARLLLPADRGGRRAPGRRDRADRGVRAGDHGAEVHHRGRGAGVRQRHRIRPGVIGLDVQRRHRGPDDGADGLRLRVDQHPHPADRGDAARRVQEVRVTARTCRCTGSRTTPESSTSCTITVSVVEAG